MTPYSLLSSGTTTDLNAANTHSFVVEAKQQTEKLSLCLDLLGLLRYSCTEFPYIMVELWILSV